MNDELLELFVTNRRIHPGHVDLLLYIIILSRKHMTAIECVEFFSIEESETKLLSLGDLTILYTRAIEPTACTMTRR